MPSKFDNVPTKACYFDGGSVKLSKVENGNVPIKMLVRSRQPVDHPYWGRVVHDIEGAFHYDKIPVDYCHGEEIGFLDTFDKDDPAGLMASGQLVPTDDPADTVRKLSQKSEGGVPYQASINFAGEGVVREEIFDGETVKVNGYEFTGPGIVIRKWPLRGVAVCPYGMDGNTSSQFTNGDTIAVTQLAESKKMPPEDTTNESSENTEAPKVKTPETPKTETVEAAKPETVQTPEPEVAQLSAGRSEAKRFTDSFGDQGAIWFAAGKSFEQCRSLEVQALRDSNAELTATVSDLNKKLALPTDGEDSPVEFTRGGEKDAKSFKFGDALFSRRN